MDAASNRDGYMYMPMKHLDPRMRAVIGNVRPEVDVGRFPAKRIIGDVVDVEADIFADGHDALSALLLHRHEDEREWTETPFEPLVNDRWQASFRVARLGRYRYTVEAWADRFVSWRQAMRKRLDAGQETKADLLIGAELLERAAARASMDDRRRLSECAALLRSPDIGVRETADVALSEEVATLVTGYPDRTAATRYDRELEISVDPPKARFSTWYEMFPRSCSSVPGKHGTLRDCEERLPYIASMGFDVLYLPPIHVRHWELDSPHSPRELIAQVNQIRRENAALQNDWSLRFHETGNDLLLCYSKHDQETANTVVAVVTLDPHYKQAGWVSLDVDGAEAGSGTPYQMHDLLTDARLLWRDGRNYMELDPHSSPAHIFRVRRRVLSERDFDYYM